MTRTDLRKALMAKGLTYREANKVIDTVIGIWTRTLRETHELDLGFGVISIERIRPHRDYKLGRIVEYKGLRFNYKETTNG